MATDSLGTADHLATPKQLRAIDMAMKVHGITTPQLAAMLRISRSHLYGMLRGGKPMAFHYLLSIKFVLLEHKLGRKL